MGAFLTSETETRSAFFAALAERRAAVLASVRDLDGADALVAHAQGLILDAARRGRADLDPAEIIPALEEAELPLDAPLADGVSLRKTFEQPAAHGDTISALLAEGLRLELADQDAEARRERISTLIKLLPGIERLGPFVIGDFVDAALSEEDASLFWQVYVDRIVAEVKRHTRAARPPKEPWMVLALLRVHRAGPGKSGPPAWGHLRLHINRALQAARHRWRFIRQLAEDSNDVELLHFLCGSAAMVDDPETLVAFLERGDARLISCALFTLQIRGGHLALVERIVANLEARPLPEIGGRLVEIHAQLQALSERTPALDLLVAGIRRVVQTQVAQGARVDALLEAVSDDPRALRQSILLADAVPGDVQTPSPQLRHLLERVIGVWFQAFTPGGVAHPFNDAVFGRAVRKAVVVAANDAIIDRFVTFAADLGAHARKWAKGPDAWRRITQRFVWAFAQLAVPLAAELAARPGAQDAARKMYVALVRLYLAEPDAREAGWLGAVESVVPAMFADLLAGDPAPERVAAAADLVAEVEAELRGAAPGEDPGAAAQVEAPIDRPVVRATVRRADRLEATTPSILAVCTGWATLRDLGGRVRRLLGWRTQGEAIVAGESLLIRGASTRRGEALDSSVERVSLDALTELRVKRPLLGLHVVAGASALIGAAAYGGQLAFAGIRGADTSLALLGAGVIGAGLAFDAAAQALARRAREKVLVSLGAGGDPVVLEVDTREGAALLDALMAADARRRELALYASLSSKDTAWGEAPSDAPDASAEVDDASDTEPATGEDDAPPDEDDATPVADDLPTENDAATDDDPPADDEPPAEDDATPPEDVTTPPADDVDAAPAQETEDEPAQAEPTDPAPVAADEDTAPALPPLPKLPKLPSKKPKPKGAPKTMPALPGRLRPKKSTDEPASSDAAGPPRDIERS